jgi:hypothetical protein
LFRLAWPDDATRWIKILNEFFRLNGTLKAVLHDAKFLGASPAANVPSGILWTTSTSSGSSAI